MKEYRITIDCGTTNTRAILWHNGGKRVATQHRPIGVRNTAIDGHNGQLKTAVRDCLEALLAEGGITYEGVLSVIASGMISSNVGLVEIPHVTAPAGIQELAAGITPQELPDVCPLPIWFVPGIKNYGGEITLDNYRDMDVMRGEEVESVALINQIFNGKPMLLILPGSHTKFVGVDAGGRITGCVTTIAGELLSTITSNTIIADAVGRQLVEIETYNRDMLLEGYRCAQKNGLGRTCFSARILNNFTGYKKIDIANFLLGAVLSTDISAIKASSVLAANRDTIVVITGKEPLQQAMTDILQYDAYFQEVRVCPPDKEIPLSASGALLIAGKSKHNL